MATVMVVEMIIRLVQDAIVTDARIKLTSCLGLNENLIDERVRRRRGRYWDGATVADREAHDADVMTMPAYAGHCMRGAIGVGTDDKTSGAPRISLGFDF